LRNAQDGRGVKHPAQASRSSFSVWRRASAPFALWASIGLLGAQGTAVPEKKLYADRLPGVTVGPGQTSEKRAATAQALQQAINECAAHGWELVIPPGVYEIDSAAGLLANNTNYDGALWIAGTQQARIIQFHQNAPIFTVGNPAKGASDYSINVNIDGLRVEYGVSQTGKANANALQIGALRSSHLAHIWMGADGVAYEAPHTPYRFPAYRAFYLVAGATPEFSNTFTDFFIEGAQYRLVDMSSLGTSSVFTNWYCSNGYFGQPGLLRDAAWYLNNGDGVFTNMNFESIIANVIINGQTLRSSRFSNIHLETIQLTGADPYVFVGGTNRIIVDDFGVTGLYFTSSVLNTLRASGVGRVMSTYYDDALSVRNLQVSLQNAGNLVNLPLVVFWPGAVGDEQPTIEATNISIDDFVGGGLVAHVSLDPNMPLADFAGPKRVSHYRWGSGVSKATGAVRVIAADYKAYGQDEDPTFEVPAEIHSFTLTLAEAQAARGLGAALMPAPGNLVHVRRMSGKAAGTLTIADEGAGVIVANTESAKDLYFRFDGQRYRQVGAGAGSATR
jgi:hypothetical protein